MIVVSDTSPITNLIQLDQLSILHNLFEEITVTESVYKELSQVENHKIILERVDWIKKRRPNNIDLIHQLQKELDLGEAESIALALEVKADYLLIDEKKGRLIARRYGIEITGLLGVLLKAKEKKLISSVKHVMDELIIKAGFRIDPLVYSEMMRIANE